MEKYKNDKNDFLQTQRIKQLDKYSIRIKYSYLHSSTNRKLFDAFVYVLYHDICRLKRDVCRLKCIV